MAGKKRFLRKYDGQKWIWLQDAKKFLLLVFALFLLFRFVIGFSCIDGKSMMDTFQSGDLVLYTRINREIQRGDIISVAIPSGEYYVKRVVALGGDVVDLRDGTLYINGEAETGDYIRGETHPEEGGFTYPLTISEGDAFVLGDNRSESIDSRFFGAVNLRQTRGVLRVHIGRWFIRLL